MGVFGDVSSHINSPPEKKGRQMGKFEQKEINILVILMKQVLKQSRMQALLQSAILECFIVQKEFQLIKDLMQVKQDFVDTQKVSSTEEKHKMGQMHIRVWDKWIEVVLTRMERGAAIQDADQSMCLEAVVALKEYQKWMETVGLVGVCDKVKVIHIGRAWDKEKKKLFFHSVPGTQTHRVWMNIIRPHLLGPEHHGCRQCLGTEPRGDLERKLQEYIEKMQSSKKKDKDKKGNGKGKHQDRTMHFVPAASHTMRQDSIAAGWQSGDSSS